MTEIAIKHHGRRGLAGPVVTAACVARLLKEPVESLVARGVVTPLDWRGLDGGLLFDRDAVAAVLEKRDAHKRAMDLAWASRHREARA